jgi:predicted DNA-binding transcriptional regulator YafY
MDDNEGWVPLEFERYITLVEKIEREPNWKTTRYLARELEDEDEFLKASLRQVQRILEYFRDRFGLLRKKLTNQRGAPYVWAWPKRGGRFPIPLMDPPTALTYQLAAELLAPLLPPAFLKELEWDLQRARKALVQTGKQASRLPGKVRVLPRGIARQPAKVDPGIVSAVLDGLLTNRQLRVRYEPRFDGRSGVNTYVISPLGLVFRFDTLYLVLVVDEPPNPERSRDFVMEWPLQRFRSAKVTDVKARAPSGFDLDRHLESARFLQNLREPELQALGPTFRLEALFDSRIAVYLEERPFAANQTMHAQLDGRLLVTATVANTRELLSEIHAFGADVEIVSPGQLRSYFADLGQRLHRIYTPTQPPNADPTVRRVLRPSPRLAMRNPVK